MRTKFNNGLQTKPTENLLDNRLCGKSNQVWTALAEIGRQLQVLAQAQMGQGSFRAEISPPVLYAPDSPTVVELVNQFLLVKARAGKSERYLRALRGSLSRFVTGRAHKPAHEVTNAEIEKWMVTLKVSPRTQRGYVSDLRTLFNFAIRRGLLKFNPASGVELPSEIPTAVEIHTPNEVRQVLNFARNYDLNICRALAVRYFTGLRTAEVERIDETAFKADYLEVSAANAKTRRRRLVTIQPVLRAWLALGGVLPAPPANGRKMLEFMRALTLSGVKWPHNATRHSFVSYHLGKFQNAGKTALEAGHTEQMLFAHYREIVTPDAAEEFWNIFPVNPVTASAC